MPAVQVTAQQLWDFFYVGNALYCESALYYEKYLNEKKGLSEEPLLDSTVFAALRAANVNVIVVGKEMSEDGLDGRDLVDLCSNVMYAIEKGYTIFYWYGPASEVIIVGYIPDELTIDQEGYRETDSTDE